MIRTQGSLSVSSIVLVTAVLSCYSLARAVDPQAWEPSRWEGLRVAGTQARERGNTAEAERLCVEALRYVQTSTVASLYAYASLLRTLRRPDAKAVQEKADTLRETLIRRGSNTYLGWNPSTELQTYADLLRERGRGGEAEAIVALAAARELAQRIHFLRIEEQAQGGDPRGNCVPYRAETYAAPRPPEVRVSDLGTAYFRSVPRAKIIKDAVLFLVAAVLAGAVAAWISSSRRRPFAIWARHPWKVFWVSCIIPIIGSIITIFNTGLLGLVFLPPVVLLFTILVVLSAVRGLALAWQKSHARSVLIIAPLVVLDLVRAVGPRLPGEPEIYRPPFLAMSWILAASVASYLIGRLASKDKTVA